MNPSTNYVTELGLSYLRPDASDASDYQRRMCRFDLYRPNHVKDFPTVVYFHGGSLIQGARHIHKQLENRGWAVVAPSYRLNPHVRHPAYIQDAASAVAWVFNHIGSLGGDPRKIFVAGFSAGGYLASMITLDKQYLAVHGIDSNRIAGTISLGGASTVALTVKEEQGHPNWRPLINEFAPIYHCRKDAPPILCVNGGWDLELPPRVHETSFFVAAMKQMGHKDVEHVVIDHAGHEDSVPESWHPIIRFIERLSSPRP